MIMPPKPPTVEPAVKRQRILTQKGFQNTLLQETSDFNKETKALQSAIFSVHAALRESETSKLKSATALLENKYLKFEQDTWKETVDVEPVVERTSYNHIQQAEATLLEAAKKLSGEAKKTSSKRSGRSASGHSGRSTRSRVSSTSARIQDMADAAAARRQAEYDLLMAEKENARKQKDAHDERERAAAKAQHDHDMAVLAARKLTASSGRSKTKCHRTNYIKRNILSKQT